MTPWLNNLALWLADYYLAATLGLAAALAAMAVLRSASRRIAVAWAASIGLVVLLVLAAISARPAWTLNSRPVEHNTSNAVAPTSHQFTAGHDLADTAEGPAARTADVPHAPSRSAADSAAAANVRPWFAEWLDRAGRAAMMLFLAGSTVVACWLAIGAARVLRWRRRCTPAAKFWQQQMAIIAGGSACAPRLLVSETLDYPSVLGIWRPAIILPARFVRCERPSAVRQALRHEWAHIAGRDHLLAALQRWLMPLLYLHPLYWLLRRKTAIDQEYRADRSVATYWPPTLYAENLIRWTKTYATGHPRPGAALGLFQRPPLLAKRVAALLEDAPRGTARASRTWLAAAVPASALAIWGASSLTVRPAATPLPAIALESGRLSGVVVDSDGQPLAGVLVDLRLWCPGDETRTDQQGRFQLAAVEEDEAVLIRFSKPGYSPRLVAELPAVREPWIVALDTRTYIEGRVVDPQRNGVARAVVRAHTPPKRVGPLVVPDAGSQTTTDGDGRYRLYVRPDVYVVEASSSSRGVARSPKLAIADGEAHTLDLELAAGVPLQATFVDAHSGKRVSGARLWDFDHRKFDARASDSGVAVVPQVLPGRYRIQVAAEGYARWWRADANEPAAAPKGWRRQFDPRPMDVAADMQPWTVLLERAVRLSGRVLDPEGRPVAGATVAPALSGTGNSITGDARYSVPTDAEGSFELWLPSSGTTSYNLIAHDGKYRTWRRWSNATGDRLETRPGQHVGDIELRLTRPGAVRGRVVDAAGRPVAGRNVYAHAADGRSNRYYQPMATSGNDGHFELRFVQPGDQFVQLSPLFHPPGASKAPLVVAPDETLDMPALVVNP